MKARPQYPKERCPFYGLSSQRKLTALLRVRGQSQNTCRTDKCYSVFTVSPDAEGKKSREIQTPLGQLKDVHTRIQRYLSRIRAPGYLKSVRGFSNIDNAKFHLGCPYVTTMDVENFYPSCGIELVFQFFHYEMNIAEDLSWILSDICTYSGHIPTGSQFSGTLAYWANKLVFDEIFELAKQNGLKFTLLVDDMTFSSSYPIRRDLPYLVNSILKQNGLKLKRKKTVHFSKRDSKIITGGAIDSNGKLRVINRHRKRIISDLQTRIDFSRLDESSLRSVLGRIGAANQIEEKLFSDTRKMLRRHQTALNKDIVNHP